MLYVQSNPLYLSLIFPLESSYFVNKAKQEYKWALALGQVTFPPAHPAGRRFAPLPASL